MPGARVAPVKQRETIVDTLHRLSYICCALALVCLRTPSPAQGLAPPGDRATRAATGETWKSMFPQNASSDFIPFPGDAPRHRLLALDAALLRSLTGESWSDSAPGWIPNTLDTIAYDGSGKRTSILEKNFVGGAWVNRNQVVMAYDSLGRVISQLDQDWTLEAWENRYRWSYAYGLDTVVELQQAWQDPLWTNLSRFTHTSSPEGLAKELLYQSWGDTGWADQYRHALAYVAPGRLASVTLRRAVATGWENVEYRTWEYGPDGKLLRDMYQRWDLGAWQNVDQTLHAFAPDGRPALLLAQQWNGVGWADSRRISYAYEDSAGVRTMLTEAWNGASWVNRSRDSTISEQPGRPVAFVMQSWIEGAWRNTYRLLLRWTVLPTAAASWPESPGGYALTNSYPNPFNPSTSISFVVPQRSLVSVTIFDVLGREMERLVAEEKQPGSYTVSWNAADAPSGVYFCRLSAGKFTQTRKMMLLR